MLQLFGHTFFLGTRGDTCPGGIRSIFVRRGCAIFQAIVFAFFPRTVYQKKTVFWSRLSKHVRRANFVRSGYYLVQFCVLEYILSAVTCQLSPIFSRSRYHLKAELLETGEQIFSWAHPCTNSGKLPPPLGSELLEAD